MATVESIIPGLLMARLAELVVTPALSVAWPDAAFPGLNSDGTEKPKPPAYLRVQFLPNDTDRLFIGNGEPHRFKGLFQVSVVWPAGQGIVAPLDIAGKIVEHFAEGSRFPIGAGVLRIDKRPSVARPLQEADHIQIPVTIEWVAYV